MMIEQPEIWDDEDAKGLNQYQRREEDRNYQRFKVRDQSMGKRGQNNYN